MDRQARSLCARPLAGNVMKASVFAFLGLLLAACAPTVVPAPGQNPGPIPPPADATITLTRGVCFGFCPDYTVTINGEGAVTYTGRRFVNVTGEQHATIERAQVQALLAEFDRVNFMSLQDSYRANVTDLPTYRVSLTRNGQTKTVVDYGGLSAGMPEGVRHLQDEIDRVANTGRWVLRDGQPVRTRPEP
jgi:Domain of unknown function (DUF6438)